MSTRKKGLSQATVLLRKPPGSAPPGESLSGSGPLTILWPPSKPERDHEVPHSVLLIGLVFLTGLCAQAHAASFECGKARTKLEKAICSTPELNAADTQMGERYREALKSFPLPGFVEATQQAFLADYRSCDIPDGCIRMAQDRAAELALYKAARVYSNAKRRFNPDEDIVFLVYSRQGTTYLRLFGDYMPDANTPQPFPYGFVCDENLEVGTLNHDLAVRVDDDPDSAVQIVIADDVFTLDDFLSCSPRTGIARGYPRVRAASKP